MVRDLNYVFIVKYSIHIDITLSSGSIAIVAIFYLFRNNQIINQQSSVLPKCIHIGNL